MAATSTSVDACPPHHPPPKARAPRRGRAVGDEVKPKLFAEAIEVGGNPVTAFGLFIEGRQVAVWLNYTDAHAVTAALNAAVEAREARLVAALRGLYEFTRAPAVLLHIDRP